jgi:hypothetical protein
MSQPNSRSPSRSPSVASPRSESGSAASEREDREGAPKEATQSPLRQSKKRRRRPEDVPESSDEGGNPRSESATRNALPRGTNEGDTSRAMTKTVDGAVDKVGDTATEVTGGGEGGDGGDKPLKMRLDLNLDVDVELEARVRGDLTLGLQ